MHIFRSLLSITRPVTSVLAGLLGMTVYSAATFGVDGRAYAMMFGIGMSLCMFGYVVNDLSDVAKDRTGLRSDKPLAADVRLARYALVLAIALAGAALMLAWPFAGHAFTGTVLSLLALLAYSPLSRTTPMLKGLYTGLLTCTPFLIGCLAGDGAGVSFLFLLPLVGFIWGYEILMDVAEVACDARSKFRTLPVRFGASRMYVLAWVLMFMSLGIALRLVQQLRSEEILLAALAVLVVIMLGSGHESSARAVKLTKVAMLMTLGTFVVLI